MKFSTSAILAFANIAFASPVPDASSPSLVKRATNAFAVGTRFNIEGSTNYFVGSNSYWISYLSNPADVDQTMAHLQASGLKVLRVWGFNDVSQATSGDWMQSFIPGQAPQINLGPNGLGKLDTVVAAAEKYNIKLIIPFVNYWTDYGGMQKYTSYYGVAWKDFYTTPAVQAQYRTYISTVVNKYKSSTSIFAWELANEPRCPGCATSVITNWATTTSAYIKSLDPNHMVTIGDEGFMNGGGDGSYAYSTAEGIDFAQNILIPSIDFAVFHLYPEYWSLSAQPGGNNWFKNHAAVCLAAGKPCVAEEYSFTTNKIAVMGSWQADSLAAPGMAGDMFWQWGEVLPNAGTTHNDGHAIYYGSSDWAYLVRDHVSSANALGGGGPVTSTSSRVSTTTTTRSTTPVVTTTSVSVTTTVSRTTSTTTTTSVSRTSSTASRTTSAATTSTSAVGGTVPRWGKCGGGPDFTGPFVCESPWVCTFSNQWYSQCL